MLHRILSLFGLVIGGIVPIHALAGAWSVPVTVSPLDLASLRDMAAPAISPDGRTILFQERAPDPLANLYRTRWLVLDIASRSVSTIADAGEPFDFVQENGIINGSLDNQPEPIWRGDSRAAAFVRRAGQNAELWLWDAGLGQARLVARLTHEVGLRGNGGTPLAWSQDQRRILYRAGRDIIARQNADSSEGLTGYVYDDRFLADRTQRPRNFPCVEAGARHEPLPDGSCILSLRSVSLESGIEGDASQEDVAFAGNVGFLPSSRSRHSASATLHLLRDAWVGPPDPTTPASANGVHARIGTRDYACVSAACLGGPTILGWAPGADQVIFLKREGAADGLTALYAWAPEIGSLRRMSFGNDVLNHCSLALGTLVCLHESATTPARLEEVSLANGALRELYDPNPQFVRRALGRVVRVALQSAMGDQAYADVILPPGYRAGAQYPAVFTIYESSGFLRGGTGDELPLQTLAASGFIVASIQQPRTLAGQDVTSMSQAQAIQLQERFEKRRNMEVLNALLADPQIGPSIDRRRIGIWGLSNGASTALYALGQSDLFAAASITSIPRDPTTYYLWPASSRRSIREISEAQPGTDFTTWRYFSYSVRRSLDRIRQPILIQSSDHELISSLEGFVTLQDAGRPVEMIVYPGEWHIKMQPAHRLAAYERNLDWFRFWLLDQEDSRPDKAPQYIRWRRLRAARTDG